MNKRISEANPKILKFNIATQFWIELSAKIGFRNMNRFFEEINNEKVKNPDARQKFLKVLILCTGDKEAEKWYNEYADCLMLDKE